MTFAALVFLFWGEIYSIFPALCADTFGVEERRGQCRHDVHGQGHGLAAGAAGVGAVARAATGTACSCFSAAITIAAGLAAKFVLPPMRRSDHRHARTPNVWLT